MLLISITCIINNSFHGAKGFKCNVLFFCRDINLTFNNKTIKACYRYHSQRVNEHSNKFCEVAFTDMENNIYKYNNSERNITRITRFMDGWVYLKSLRNFFKGKNNPCIIQNIIQNS